MLGYHVSTLRALVRNGGLAMADVLFWE